MTARIGQLLHSKVRLSIVGAVVAGLVACGGPGGGGGLGVNSVTIIDAPASNQLAVGATVDLGVSVSVSVGVSQAVEWTSSNTTVASVDASGVVSAKALGVTTIT